MIIIGGILIGVGVLFILVGMGAGITEKSFIMFSTGIVLGIILEFAGYGLIQCDFKEGEDVFKNAVDHQKYETVRTFVNGVYKNKIVTKDGTFNVTKYSKFTDVVNLKVDQVVTITYINERYGINHLIDVKAEPMVDKKE